MGICKNNRNKKEKINVTLISVTKSEAMMSLIGYLPLFYCKMAESPYYHSINKR